MDIAVTIAIIAAVVIIAIATVWVVSSGKSRDLIRRQQLEIEEKNSKLASLRASVEELRGELGQRDRDLAKAEEAAKSAERLRENDEERHRQAVEELKDNYNKSLAKLEEAQKNAIEAARTALALENEKNLKAREEALKKEAAETMKNITGGLDQTIKGMTEAFEEQKKSHTEASTSIKTQFAETVRHLKEQTETIGNTAEDLAKALKGQSKVQGIFGETILENILKSENLTEGRDYDSEFWLRDRKGNRIVNDETGKTMRPDFALHFPDNTDILIDSKVSLTALADYFAAETDEERAAASARNLASIENHIRELTGKEYQKYVAGRKTLDYVIMFIPNYGAYQLAKMEDKDIFAKAFRQNVLITTEETLIPFLRLIRTAWVQKEQMEHIDEIVKAATDMV
ncbi:MAG: DNA recombination protein RmuC, partial [Bacteroidales bacterium]|nr:DNA recombination protein RmuC [Bacteroidales bacterium]